MICACLQVKHNKADEAYPNMSERYPEVCLKHWLNEMKLGSSPAVPMRWPVLQTVQGEAEGLRPVC